MEQTSFFEALYTPCIHSNGSYTTISIHRTKEGAEKAIELAKAGYWDAAIDLLENLLNSLETK